MSSDSDSEDDAQIKKLMEAADTTLLNNYMFEKKDEAIPKQSVESVCNEMKGLKNDFPKSQRYITEDTAHSGIDFNLPESMQRHLEKKFNEISEKYYEFYDAPKNNLPKIKTQNKNGVKLLKGSECFVNSYEDFEYDTKVPIKKPVIKRRIVDQSDCCIEKDALKSIAMDGNFILSGQEVNNWAKNKERKDKVFHYKMASNGVLHPKEEINEFSEMRRKNKWNENKIKKLKRT